MKVVKRSNVFETNSSSVHSVTKTSISSDYDYNQVLSMNRSTNRVRVTGGKFGWGYEEYSDAETKLSYALTMALEIEIRNHRIKNLEDFINSDSYKMIDEAVARSYNCDGIECRDIEIFLNKWSDGSEYVSYDGGYIDHQSSEGYTTLAEWLDDMNVTLDEFIFDKNSKLIISNDN